MPPLRINIELAQEVNVKRCFFSFKKRNRLTGNRYDISVGLASGNVNGSGIWDDKDRSRVTTFLQQYRMPPLAADFDIAIADAFRKFLFSSFQADQVDQFNRLLDEEIVISAKASNARMLTNFPWELCLLPAKPGATAIDQDELYLQCLSRTAVSRGIDDIRSVQPAGQHALKFLYVISDPDYNTPAQIPADDFDREINLLLKKRQTLLSFSALTRNDNTGDRFKPSFLQLITQIDVQRPNVLVIVAHGRTVNGVPQLSFQEGWRDVADLANHLRNTNSVYIVYLIACDLAFYDDGSASSSGAKVLLDAGIPAVVAMQSSILAPAAVKFIESLIDHMLFCSANEKDFILARAVQFARHHIYRYGVARPRRDLDWSFPALFMAEDGHVHITELSRLVNAYIESLRFLQRKSFPVQAGYYPRPEQEQSIQAIFNMPGVHFIHGRDFSGKTSVFRKAGERYLQQAIDNEDANIRPLLYIDLSIYRDNPLENLISLINIVNQKIQQLKFPGTPFMLFNPISAADIAAAKNKEQDILVSFLEKSRAILVLDNITPVQLENIGGIISGFHLELRNSVVVVLTEQTVDKYRPVHPVLEIDNLSQEETEQFIALNGGLPATDYFQLTGGNIFALTQVLKGKVMPEDEISREDYAIETLQTIQEEFGESSARAVLALSVLPMGLNPELAKYFPEDWSEIEKLKDKEFVVGEETGDDDLAYFIPAFIAQSWQYLFEEDIEVLCQRFIDQFAEAIGDDPYTELAAILNMEGGFEFIRAVILMVVKKDINDPDNLALVRNVAIVLHTELYKRSEWFRSYEIWSLYLGSKNLAVESTECRHWLRFGKTALLLGFMDNAQKCIEVAKALLRSAMDKIELNDLEASYFKAAGLVEKKKDIENLYTENEKLIEEELKADDAELAHLEKKKALNLYNRAIFEKWWNRDTGKARDMLAAARDIYQQQGDELMMYVLEKEEADMLIDDLEANPASEEAILGKLHRSRKYFEQKKNKTELNEVYYRLARLYKKLYGIKNEIDYVNKSIAYYGLCEESARESINFRMEQFAHGNKIILLARYGDASKKSGAVDEIDLVIKRLAPYGKDAWTARVITGFRWCQAVFLKGTEDKTKYLQALLDSFKLATTPPLHHRGKHDLGMAAMILDEIILYYTSNQMPAALGEFYHEYKEQLTEWFDDPDLARFKSEQFKQYLDSITIKSNYYG